MVEEHELISWVAGQTQLKKTSILTCLNLFEGGATIPFVARYRKEQSGNLDETQLASIQKFAADFKELSSRKAFILKQIKAQGQLDKQLEKKILSTYKLVDLEDLYLPYKKRRETKADKARKVGLEPLAKIIMAQNTKDLHGTAHAYVNLVVKSEAAALEGARNIISEWMNERKSLRDMLRRKIFHKGAFHAKLVKGKEEEAQKYRNYFDWKEPIKGMAAHRFLAMSRAEKEGYLRLKLTIKPDLSDEISNFFVRKDNAETKEQIKKAAADAWKRLLLPALETEFKNDLKQRADEESIIVFADNLRQLLMEAPLGQKRILAIDPGFKSGCKVVCLDETGKLLHNETIFPHPPQNKKSLAAETLIKLASKYKIEAIAIGNGTAGRETDRFVQELNFQDQLSAYVVNENGASVYSASKLAREEFPDYDLTVRGAVSIGRRLMDPLAELVKIEPKAIGVGQYQHDVNQKLLKTTLDNVVESCVNKVGVNLNTASKHLLKYISAFGPKLAEAIVTYRDEHGLFESREELKKVNGLGDKAFEQAAGFLRIYGGKEPLDQTGIHPEEYAFVKSILHQENISIEKLKSEKERLKKVDWQSYKNQDFGMLSLQDIQKELEQFGISQRPKRKLFEFDPDIKSIEDLKVGAVLPAKVTNITNFGAFVDVGAKIDGLVHLSQMANHFVKDPSTIVKLNQELKVKVTEVDLQRKRIQLSMKAVGEVENE